MEERKEEEGKEGKKEEKQEKKSRPLKDKSDILLTNRRLRLLQLLPKHNFAIGPAAVEAGYSKEYAYSQPSQIRKAALNELRKIEKRDPQRTERILGITREQLEEELAYIQLQRKDLATKFRALQAVAPYHGIDLTSDQPQVRVPILNVVVEPKKLEKSPQSTQIEAQSPQIEGGSEEKPGEKPKEKQPETTPQQN